MTSGVLLLVMDEQFEMTADGENVVGPVTLDQVRRGLVAGKIPPEAKARRAGTSEWVPVAVLLASVGAAEAPTSAPGPDASASGTDAVPPARPVGAITASRSNVPFIAAGILGLTVLGLAAWYAQKSGSPTPSKPTRTASVEPRLDPEEATQKGFELYDREKPDEAGAVKLWEPACEAGNDRACVGMGIAYTFGIGGKTKDYDKGLKLIEPACTKGIQRACSALGQMNMFGWGVPKDIAKAKTLWTKACDEQEGRACYFLGLAMTASDGPPEWRDIGNGEKLQRRGCDHGYWRACNAVKKLDEKAEIEKLRAKVKRKYWDAEPDGMCTGKGFPKYKWEYEGGTFAEDEQVATADGCVKLYKAAELQTYCCPTVPF